MVDLTINYHYNGRDCRKVIRLDYKIGIWLCTFLSDHPDVLSCWTEAASEESNESRR